MTTKINSSIINTPEKDFIMKKLETLNHLLIISVFSAQFEIADSVKKVINKTIKQANCWTKVEKNHIKQCIYSTTKSKLDNIFLN